MNLSATAIDEIDGIAVMFQTLACLGVLHEDLKILDDIKSVVKQKLTMLPKKSSFKAREVRTTSNARLIHLSVKDQEITQIKLCRHQHQIKSSSHVTAVSTKH